MTQLQATTHHAITRDLHASLHQLRLQRVMDLLLNLDVTEDRTQATYAAKLAINSLEPDAFDAGIVKAAERVHQALGGTQPWRDAPLYERAFALSLAMQAVTDALNVWKEITPSGDVAQAVADLTVHKAALVEYGRRVVVMGSAK